MTRSIAAAAATLLLLTGAAAAQPALPGSIFANGARTYYDAVDLGTPEAAARAFLGAWARHDYATANVILSPAAQQGWSYQIARSFSVKPLFPAQADAIWSASVYGSSDGPQRDEIILDQNLLFDDLLRTAERLDALPFAIGAAPRLGAQTVTGDAATLPVETDGRPVAIELKLVRLPSGRWKVDQVTLPDADPALKPWGFRPE